MAIGSLEEKQTMNESRNAVVKTLTLSLDARKSHNQTNIHNTSL
jgi:hypothetical protein